MEDEGLRGTVLSIVQAAKARPHQGTVIAQVRWITKFGWYYGLMIKAH